MQFAGLSLAAAVTFANFSIDTYASSNKVTSVLPQAGITYALGSNQYFSGLNLLSDLIW